MSIPSPYLSRTFGTWRLTDISLTVLDFAALHNIKAVIQEFPMTEEGIKEAIDRLEAGKVHFRAVLVAQ